MTYFATFFTGIFSTISAYLLKFVSRKFALALTGVTVFLAMLLSVFLALKALVLTLVVTISNQYLLLGITALIPDNFELCLSAYFSSRITLWAYNLNKDIVVKYMNY